MAEGNEQLIQGKLKGCEVKLEKDEFFIEKSKPIYPERGGTGFLQEELRAITTGGKIRGLKGYQACESAPLYYDGRFWSIRSGERFGTYSSNAHKRSSR